MKFSEARPGRVLVARLEHGEVIHETIERLAREQGITAASLIILGGVDRGSKLVVGPQEGDARPVKPMEHELDEVHEVCGTGTLFPNQDGEPALHMHIACGRNQNTATGCIRRGVKTWVTLEVIIHEVTASTARRGFDESLGFETLQP